MKPQNRPEQRREMMSSPRIQLRILLAFALVVIMYVGTGYWIAYRLMNAINDQLLELPVHGAARNDIILVLQQQSWVLEMQMKLYTFITICAAMTSGLFLSHRIGGPVYHLTTYCKELAEGATPPRRIRFRKNDFFHGLAAAFNTLQERRGLLTPQPPDAGRPAGEPREDAAEG